VAAPFAGRRGRPRKMTPRQRQEAIQRLAAGETQADVAPYTSLAKQGGAAEPARNRREARDKGEFNGNAVR